ncbi:MAG: DUF2225 domain-containing protein [Spirochaetales bacterium]|nr:DUF2225 domain-containing protein [Spirochaetales bacterium]MCF7937119.1 DUF2225 domain-containing protein [Spirochaetales bacterium]
MSDEAVKVTYYSKNSITCPVCGATFYREELLTGRGRLIAGELTEELRRLYQPSQKFGEVSPLLYSVTVCPSCFYAVYQKDFLKPDSNQTDRLESTADNRIAWIQTIFEDLDYTEPRGLAEGAASYLLAIRCYDTFEAEDSPTAKQGIASLRGAWLMGDLHRKFPGENYDYLQRLLYRKARFFYTEALEREQNGSETLSDVEFFGPDLDKNYGYDGFLYITAVLEYRYGPKDDPEQRTQSLQQAKRIVSRLFGMGKASKEKPTAILDAAKDLYDKINQDLQEEGGS